VRWVTSVDGSNWNAAKTRKESVAKFLDTYTEPEPELHSAFGIAEPAPIIAEQRDPDRCVTCDGLINHDDYPHGELDAPQCADCCADCTRVRAAMAKDMATATVMAELAATTSQPETGSAPATMKDDNGHTAYGDDDYPIECIDWRPDDTCRGLVEWHNPGHGYAVFSRCSKHQDARLKREDETRRRYPEQQPSDFDSAYAGEEW